MGTWAHICLVWLKTDPSIGYRGVSAIWVPLDSPGVSRLRFDDLGWRSTERASLFFDNVRVPVNYRVGEEGTGFSNAMWTMNVYRTMMAVHLVGVSLQSIEEAINYAKERKAFGRPILKFDSVSHRLMDSLTKVEAVKLLTYKALWALDVGKRGAKEAAMAKALAPKVALEACTNAYLTYGHVAYSTDYPLEKRIRDIYGFQFADGSVETMRNTLLREIVGGEYLSYRKEFIEE